ncbi:hypothetical protein L917_09175 [Phytophthora nicotianae]|uniref:Uncharacterized protein n=1 Tax=Phytophthora nicotianae TaxID=4792 RepID=W2L553_PHYNI|nr:hypothetical protein L917_09175 [Phytophthora nicotianae]
MLGKSKGVVDDVFKLLNLNTVLDDLLSHANWGAWVKYVEDSIPQNHRKDVLLETLLKHYDDQHTLSMLTKAMEDPSTTEIATALESHLSQAIKNQVNIWKDKRLGPGDVLKAFPAGEYASLDDIVGSNFLNSWVRYVDNVAPDADKVSEILTPLISRFGTDGVMNAIASSSAAQSKSLEDLLFNNWLGGPRVQSRTVEIVKRFVRSAFGNNVPKRVDDIVARYAVRYEKEGKTANDILRNIEATIARTATL